MGDDTKNRPERTIEAFDAETLETRLRESARLFSGARGVVVSLPMGVLFQPSVTTLLRKVDPRERNSRRVPEDRLSLSPFARKS